MPEHGTADRGHAAVGAAPHVGWVSTELHLRLGDSTMHAGQMIRGPPQLAEAVSRWLGIDRILERPFSELSQGEQKLVLIGGAVASRPPLLVMDEPCQGLSNSNRRRVLELLEAIGRAGCSSIVYITHHTEEVLPCITHVLHLRGGVATFSGKRQYYCAERAQAQTKT
jgi:molybdate transport system ATP-binding protein|tara:strand:+ start:69 stop:572 length:504 start_codon:yes stop_codon:yes gene_type:complete